MGPGGCPRRRLAGARLRRLAGARLRRLAGARLRQLTGARLRRLAGARLRQPAGARLRRLAGARLRQPAGKTPSTSRVRGDSRRHTCQGASCHCRAAAPHTQRARSRRAAGRAGPCASLVGVRYARSCVYEARRSRSTLCRISRRQINTAGLLVVRGCGTSRPGPGARPYRQVPAGSSSPGHAQLRTAQTRASSSPSKTCWILAVGRVRDSTESHPYGISGPPGGNWVFQRRTGPRKRRQSRGETLRPCRTGPLGGPDVRAFVIG